MPSQCHQGCAPRGAGRTGLPLGSGLSDQQVQPTQTGPVLAARGGKKTKKRKMERGGRGLETSTQGWGGRVALRARQPDASSTQGEEWQRLGRWGGGSRGRGCG